MGGIAADVDPGRIRSTGRERKCGTCRHMVVRPPEVELARYALPIGACAPGVQCLGGAVRGWCTVLDTVVESTAMVDPVRGAARAPCCDPRVSGGPDCLYTPGGPSIRGGGSANVRRPEPPPDDGLLVAGLALVGVLAAPAIRWASDHLVGRGSTSGDRLVRGRAGERAWLDTTDGLVPVEVLDISLDGRRVWTKVSETVAERGRGERVAVSWHHVFPAAAVFRTSSGTIRVEPYSWHPTALSGAGSSYPWFTDKPALGRTRPPLWEAP